MKTGESGTSLGQVIGSFSSIRVEDYQRTYSWTEDEIEEFFEDLTAASDVSVDSHFFGTLILQESENDARSVSVVDGQQRLTTVFITISAIRDEVSRLQVRELKPRGHGRIPRRPYDEAVSMLLAPEESANEYRFEPNRFIRQIMYKSIFAEPDTQVELKKTHKNVTLALRKGTRTIRAKLRELLDRQPDEQAQLELLDQLLRTLKDKFMLLKIETSSLSESLDVFLTLNDRGMPLGPSDIVKGKIMMALGKGLEESQQTSMQEQINIEWEYLVNEVGEPETFMRHFLLAGGREKIQKKKIVDFVEKRMKPNGQEESELEAAQRFWAYLKNSASKYAILIEGALESGPARYHLSLLEGLQKAHRILLLSVVQRDDILSNPKTFDEIVRLVFVLSYRWALEDKSRQKLEDLFHELSQDVSGLGGERESQFESIQISGKDLVQKLERLCDDVEVNFHKAFRRDIDGSFISRAALHYVQRLSARNAVSLDLKKLHLEHIAPQKETPQWLKMVYAGDQSRYLEYEEIITSAGNLTLLDPGLNSKLLNKPFAEKRQEYKKSVLYITTDLSEFERWDESLIDSRTSWLVEAFSGICRAKEPISEFPPFAQWLEGQST